MPNINVSVKNKIAIADGTIYVCGNSDFVIDFDFDSEWDAYETKTARFTYNGSYADVVFTGNSCAVPIINNTFFFNVGVYAGDMHTTTAARVPCKKSILCGSGFPADPSPDVYNQIMEKLNEIDGVNPDDIAKAVSEYLTEHPIDDVSLGLTSAMVGQIIKVKAVDESGKPTEWQTVDMPSGGGETWELIKTVEIAEGAAETTALTVNTDEDGNAFALKKARLIQNFPKYTGETTVPKWSFTMVNGITNGAQAPLVYTSGLVTPNESAAAIGVYEVDLTMPGYQAEQAWRWGGLGVRGNFVPYYDARKLNGAEAIMSIGGTAMLIYPGCRFLLYGVRA